MKICVGRIRVRKLSVFELHVLCNATRNFQDAISENESNMAYFVNSLKTNAPIYVCTLLTLRHSVMLFFVQK